MPVTRGGSRYHPGRYALVLARIPHPRRTIIDVRGFEPVKGQWLNAGNGVLGSVEQAREAFAEACEPYLAPPAPKRLPVADPQTHLKPFVDFLKERAEAPLPFAIPALSRYRIVIMGEAHHRPRYWAFNTSLVRHPDFARHVGTIYLELPSHNQGLVDRFLAQSRCDPNLVIRTLRDMLWTGWPDQSMFEFFPAVGPVNQGLPKLAGAEFTAAMSHTWGQPRNWRRSLGPLDAWPYGDDWESKIRRRQVQRSLQQPELITQAAERLFAALRQADYERYRNGSNWGTFLPEGVAYQVDRHFDSWVARVCQTFSRNPIKAVDVGTVFQNPRGLPAVPYEVTLADGRVLEGTLPFTYLPRQQVWMGMQGMDWHLQHPLPDGKPASVKPNPAAATP
jgi:hypothetical protein